VQCFIMLMIKSTIKIIDIDKKNIVNTLILLISVETKANSFSYYSGLILVVRKSV
jgi:hypothetical protein